MPTTTYTPLANITLGSSASEVNFTSISSGYRDLILQINGTVLDGSRTILMGFNSDGSKGAYWNVITADGSNPLNQSADWVNVYTTYGYFNMTTTPSLVTVNAMDYSATDKHKTFLIRSSNTSNSVSLLSARWASTDAITSMRVYLNASSFATGTTMSLFGIAA